MQPPAIAAAVATPVSRGNERHRAVSLSLSATPIEVHKSHSVSNTFHSQQCFLRFCAPLAPFPHSQRVLGPRLSRPTRSLHHAGCDLFKLQRQQSRDRHLSVSVCMIYGSDTSIATCLSESITDSCQCLLSDPMFLRVGPWLIVFELFWT